MYEIESNHIKIPDVINLSVTPSIEIIWSDVGKAEYIKQLILNNQHIVNEVRKFVSDKGYAREKLDVILKQFDCEHDWDSVLPGLGGNTLFMYKMWIRRN
jgi:hypothetical protein